MRQLLPEDLFEVEHGGRIVNVDLDANRLVGSAGHAHRFDGGSRDRVNVDLARVEGLPRAAFGHVKGVGDFDDARLERETAFVHVVGQHGVDYFGNDHGQLRLAVNRWQFAAQPVEGDRHAQELVTIAVNGHADVVERQSEEDHDSCVVFGHRVVSDAVGLDTRADQQPQQGIPVVHRGADMHRAVVIHRRAPRGTVGHVPQSLNFDVALENLQHLSRFRGRHSVNAQFNHQFLGS